MNSILNKYILIHNHKRSIPVLLIIIIAIAALWLFPMLQSASQEGIKIVGEMADSNPPAAAALFVSLAAISAIFSFFSSAPIVPIAITIWGDFITIILLFGGWLIGSIAAYAIARYLGSQIVKKIVSIEKFNHYVSYLLRYANFKIVLLFRLTFPSEIGGYILGLINYPFLKYLLATSLAELPTAIIMTIASNAFLEQNLKMVSAYAVFAVVFLIVSGHLFHKKIASSRHNSFDTNATRD